MRAAQITTLKEPPETSSSTAWTASGSPFIARVDRGTAAREGEPVRLAVDTGRLHFFDLETGERIDAGD